MLLVLKWIVKGATSVNLKDVILLAFEEHGDLSPEENGKKLIYLGVDNVLVS